jgi:hypothetical protein
MNERGWWLSDVRMRMSDDGCRIAGDRCLETGYRFRLSMLKTGSTVEQIAVGEVS